MIEIKGNVGFEGTVCFDGRVLEFFGFGKAESQRIHVNQMKNVSGGRKGDKLILTVNYDAGTRSIYFDPAYEGELREMISLLREKTGLSMGV